MYSKTHKKVIDFEKDWTYKEIDFANNKGKRIVIINLDNIELVDDLSIDYRYVNQIYPNKEGDLEKFIREIRSWLHLPDKDPDPIPDPKLKQEGNSNIFADFWSKAQDAVDKTQEACVNLAKDRFPGKEEGIPKSLAIDANDEKICFVLSEDGQYYLANVNAKDGNFSWWNNAMIAAVGAAALLAGAYILVPIGIIAGLTKIFPSKSPFNIFSGKKKEEKETHIEVTPKLCEDLSKQTGYVIDIPTPEELKGVAPEAKASCIVIRIKDNPQILNIPAQ